MSAASARVPAPVLGMALFISSEVVFFGSLFAVYFTVRSSAGAWPPEGTPEIDLLRPALLTAALLASSATQHRAHLAHRGGDAGGARRWIWATVFLGALFLAGEALEWATLMDEGFEVSTNSFGALFFTMTGFHGLHLAIGLGILALTSGKIARLGAGQRSRGSMEAATYYWHFVDVVWLFVGGAVYLLGAA